MGTGVKFTQKEIKSTPGPGHYKRTEGILSETYHNVGRNNLSNDLTPIFGDSQSHSRDVQKSIDLIGPQSH